MLHIHPGTLKRLQNRQAAAAPALFGNEATCQASFISDVDLPPAPRKRLSRSAKAV
jgi:hypothetical protein